ncbi:outer membrane receptor protein involved in Fe transport [Pelomonas saccharophila]|uniref:Outer membrane receptor protein involved in Fe transport n=1 Tax=Roseateles saccharophilus TaxID=304 RepID=A0ABU1YR98_ROSSA|nr:TonB-dependent receptor [Roseateles saccharophilus]MDR7271389.1 outer membrane receptor protein involved in Fe transport [Roseateles saccharophilus]
MRLSPIALAVASTLAAAQTTETQQIERVVITAERRVTVLDTTPAAITALNGARLAERGDTGLADLVMLSPNTSVTNGQGATQLFIRGIGNVFILAGGDPGVALYSDGAYVSDQTSSNTALFDTQRVEILRGPQGALYGRNATGGAMNVISALPTSSFQARLGLLLGSDKRRESEGFVSGPLTQGLEGRLSYQVKEADGYTRNPLAEGPRSLDDQSSRALRAQLQSSLGGNGTLRFVAGHYRERDAGMSVPVLPDPVSIPVLLYGVTQSSDPRSVKSQGSSNRVEVNTAQALLEMPLGSNTLSASLSWRRSKVDRLWDSDTTEAAVTTSGFLTGSTDKSVDVHLASDEASPLQWLVGVTALQFDQSQDITILTQVPLGFLVPGAPLTVPFPGGVGFLLGGMVHTRSSAAYADLRYTLNPQWSLLAGLRVNHDSKRADEYQNIAAFGLAGTGHPSDGWTSTPGSLGVEYKPATGTLAYARWAHGFKSGAVNLGALQPNLVKPEKVSSIELGFKTEFLQRRGVFSAAVFSSRYKDMQVSQVGQATTLLANASAARIDGLEVEAAVKPIAPLTLSVGLGLMDPKYTDFTNVDLRNAPTTPVNVRGRQLAQASKQQVTLGAEWAGSVGEMRTTLRADYSWRGRFYFTEFNTPDAMQGAYGLLNLSATLRPAAGPWKLWAYVRNAGDTTAYTSMSIASPLLGAARQVTYTPPRQFAIGASYDF